MFARRPDRALCAFIFDALVLVALLVAHWSLPEALAA